MLDRRYERRRLVSTNSDRYNAFSASHLHNNRNNKPLDEYWTNGKTTLILNAGQFPAEPKLSVSPDLTVNRYRMTSSRHGTAKAEQHHVVRNSLIAGSAAGIASTLACHPFDVIRTKMQSAVMESSAATLSTSNGSSNVTKLRGPIPVISQTLRHGGLRALYTGLTLPVAAQAIYKGTIFTVNNVTQEFLIYWNTQERRKTGNFEPYSLGMMDRFICGFVGGLVNSTLFVTPVEYVRNQLINQHSSRAAGQSIKKPFLGPRDVIRQTLQTTGARGLWKGVGVTMARDSIGCGCFFYAMEWSQRRFQRHNNGQLTLAATIVSGAMAGLAYWVAALPLDSVKTWVQSDMADSAANAVKTSLRERGAWNTMQRLLTGFQVAYARGIPSAAITVTTYSLCYNALQNTDP